MFNFILLFFLALTAIIGMIDDIEDSNWNIILIKTLILLAFIICRNKSPTFYWEFLILTIFYPIIEVFYLQTIGKIIGPPIFDHLLPGIINCFYITYF